MSGGSESLPYQFEYYCMSCWLVGTTNSKTNIMFNNTLSNMLVVLSTTGYVLFHLRKYSHSVLSICHR